MFKNKNNLNLELLVLRGMKDTLCDKQLIKKDKRKQKPSALLKAPIISCMLIAFASSYYADKKRSPSHQEPSSKD